MSDILRWPFPNEPFPFLWRCSSYFALSAAAVISKIWLCHLNSTKFYGTDIIRDAVVNRPSNTPLITVTNHHSCIDDPILAGMLSWRTTLQPDKIRWTPGAHDICFQKKWHSIFFGLTRTIPVIRGAGVFQRGVDYAIEKLNSTSCWLHIFPEGKVNMEKTFIRLKWGVGRIINECKNPPIVIPIYHLGLDEILPNYPPYIPQIGKKVTIAIGDPINLDVQREKFDRQQIDALQFRKEVTDVIQDKLELLRVRTTELHHAK